MPHRAWPQLFSVTPSCSHLGDFKSDTTWIVAKFCWQPLPFGCSSVYLCVLKAHFPVMLFPRKWGMLYRLSPGSEFASSQGGTSEWCGFAFKTFLWSPSAAQGASLWNILCQTDPSIVFIFNFSQILRIRAERSQILGHNVTGMAPSPVLESPSFLHNCTS